MHTLFLSYVYSWIILSWYRSAPDWIRGLTIKIRQPFQQNNKAKTSKGNISILKLPMPKEVTRNWSDWADPNSSYHTAESCTAEFKKAPRPQHSAMRKSQASLTMHECVRDGTPAPATQFHWNAAVHLSTCPAASLERGLLRLLRRLRRYLLGDISDVLAILALLVEQPEQLQSGRPGARRLVTQVSKVEPIPYVCFWASSSEPPLRRRVHSAALLFGGGSTAQRRVHSAMSSRSLSC